MSWQPRIERGLPRGGPGYLAPVLAAATLLTAAFSRNPALALPASPIVVVAGAVVPLVVWFALGLRADGDVEENVDRLTWESPRRGDWLRVRDNDVLNLRVSTLAVLSALGAVVLAAWPR